MISKHDYDGLDVFAANIRGKKERFEKGGGWKIHSFYGVASAPRGRAEIDWSRHIGFLQEWKNSTGSITSRTALADAYIRWAWEARGEGYASEVKADSRPIVEERLARAQAELKDAYEGEQRCPEYFVVLLNIARATGADRDQFDKIYTEAIEFEPEYQYFYTEKAQFLLPRWGGRPGALANYASSLLESHDPEKGLELYYLIVSELSSYKHQDFFKETGLSWRKTKKGFLLHEKKYGASHLRVGEFMRIAWLAYDTEAVCNTSKRLQSDNDYDRTVFESPDAIAYWKNFGRSMCELPKAQNQAL